MLKRYAHRLGVKYFTYAALTVTMLSDVSFSNKTIAIIIIALLIGLSGGYLITNYNLQLKISEHQSEISTLSQNNEALQQDISNKENELDDAQNIIETKKQELITAENEINTLETNIESLESEVSQVTQTYMVLQNEYQTLLDQINETGSRYKLEYTIERPDFVQQYSLPKIYYTSYDFEIKGSATKFEYNLWIQMSGTGNPNTQIRIYKPGQYQRIHTYYLDFKVDPNTSVNYVTGSFSHILEEGTYYLEIYFDNRFSLAPANYQSSILVWDYY
jgi:cell division protein FtsB